MRYPAATDLWERSFACLAGIPVLAMGLQIGTGGVSSPSYFSKRSDVGYAYPIYSPASESHAQPSLTPGDNLRIIRETFQAPVAALASLFGVSRQAIYDWQAGK